jgi:hypothetical protein
MAPSLGEEPVVKEARPAIAARLIDRASRECEEPPPKQFERGDERDGRGFGTG